MTTSSEDVLLQVSNVRYKKGDGTLYLMTERLAWMLDHKDTVSVSHRYADIKLQKISPEGKPKIQLQVVLHDNTTSTFQFVSRQGQQAAISDRDKVKDLLVTLLPKFKRKVNKELEEKNRLLSENPGLLQLYKDLVITEVITSEEFWAHHASHYMNKNDLQKQQVGVSSAFLADIKPQTDGCNGLKYNLTPDIMESIFRTYPAVRQKHQETVPHKMPEAHFWTKFFQSHYFHRDRINTGTKDLFTECAKIDDQVLTKEMAAGVDDPLVDVASFEDKSFNENLIVQQERTGTQNIVHQNMIKRFNQHSIMVLKACQNASVDVGNNVNGGTPSSSAPHGEPYDSQIKKVSDEIIQIITFFMRIQEKISYEDLDDKEEPQSRAPAKLNLSKVERYLQGPMAGEGGVDGCVDGGTDVGMWTNRLRQEVSRWELHSASHAVVHPTTAVAALGELTPGGALMKGYHDDSLAQLVSENLAKEVKVLYCSSCELLRHFWACFPPTTPELQAKAERMHDAIRRFHSVRLKPFESKVMLEFSPLSQQLTSHLNQLLTTAYNKFDVWQSRRKQLASTMSIR
ncbi:hypothetical protein AAG570_005597 [Ranatra chinensis]|uniref:General transcription factor IIH subunit 1 n=1 Tax=Ranatra chinensis TaxID=642074 RepID=A0ABD0XXW3_9HEMI